MPDEATASAPGAAQVPGAGRPRRKVEATVVVDAGLCKACGICISLCPTHVFDRDAGGVAVPARQDDCTACRLCEWHCPDFAIEVLVERAGSAPGTPSDASGDAPEDA